MPHGEGKLTFTDGSTFEGTFKEGKRSGNGKMKFINDGDIYDGLWENDKYAG